MEVKNTGILAGMMIGLGSIAYLSIPNHIIGALLFSLGLLIIVILNFTLFTGKVGNTKLDKKGIIYLLYVLFQNVIGIGMMVGLALVAKLPISSNELMLVKLTMPTPILFSRGIGCGMLMYLAVNSYKDSKNPLCIIMPVMLFILVGFEHCIADVFYLMLYDATKLFTLQGLRFIVPIILGNSIGSIAIDELRR